jgi:ABC-type phosphate transport system ATPase subunit
MGGDGCYPQEKSEKNIGIIEHGMGSLGAGSSESAILGTFSRFEEAYPGMRFTGSVTFLSFTGIEYSSPIDLDLRYMKGALHVNHKTIHDVANRLEEIRREIGLLGSGFHKPHVITQSIEEKRAEDGAFVSLARDQLAKMASNNEKAQTIKGVAEARNKPSDCTPC